MTCRARSCLLTFPMSGIRSQLLAIESGTIAMWRLGVAVATLGSVMAVIRVQHLRALSRQSPATPLRDLDRRTIGGIGVLPPSSVQLAEMRQNEIA